MFCLSILCLFYIFAFLCFVVLCFVIDPTARHFVSFWKKQKCLPALLSFHKLLRIKQVKNHIKNTKNKLIYPNLLNTELNYPDLQSIKDEKQKS